MHYLSCLDKQEKAKSFFASCLTPESKHQKIIELGKKLPPLDPSFKIADNIVSGCQSIVYLHVTFQDDLIFFHAASEALISSGLAFLLTFVYSGEAPETILKCPPSFIDALSLSSSLSPGRSNGLASIYLRMQQESLKLLLIKK